MLATTGTRGWRSGRWATSSANWTAARAQAVPGDVAGGDRLARRVPALAEREEAGDAHCEYGRLGVYGVVQLLRRALEAEPREGEPQDLVSLLENPAGRLRDLVEGLAHAHVLRS